MLCGERKMLWGTPLRRSYGRQRQLWQSREGLWTLDSFRPRSRRRKGDFSAVSLAKLCCWIRRCVSQVGFTQLALIIRIYPFVKIILIFHRWFSYKDSLDCWNFSLKRSERCLLVLAPLLRLHRRPPRAIRHLFRLPPSQKRWGYLLVEMGGTGPGIHSRASLGSSFSFLPCPTLDSWSSTSLDSTSSLLFVRWWIFCCRICCLCT